MTSSATAPPEGRPVLLVVAGPTGTGKSEVALHAAETLGGEIVGCDALQVYRGFDSATAKPSFAERRRVPHHLIDCIEPETDFSLADYVRMAGPVIEAIGNRGRVPVVAGGTGLYLRGLLRGVIEAPARDERLRDRLYEVARRRGSETLHRLLARLDPDSAARVAAADTQRIVRAIELARSGEGSWSQRLREAGTWASGKERLLSLKIVLEAEREWLEERLARRVDLFFEEGLVEEVRGLLRKGVPRRANAFKAIGYREVLAAIEGGTDPRSTRDEIVRNTRRYAKRQRTWFRKEPGAVRIDVTPGLDQAGRRVLDLWRERAA